MAIGLIGGNFTLMQSYLSSGLSLNKYVSNLMEQKKTSFSTGSSYFEDSVFQKLGAVSSNSIELRSQLVGLASLTQYSSSVGKTAASSNEDILSVSVSKNATVSGLTTTNIEVMQLAAGQQNISAGLNANENSFGDQFSIGITDSAGKTSVFTVHVMEQDDNKAVLKAMANEINASSISVKATLVEDKETGTVNLLLAGTKTGEASGSFSVTDESAAKLSDVYTAAQDAKYSVNGKEFSSHSNEVKIMDGVTATLKKTGSAQISYAADFSPAIGVVQNFLQTFNNLMESASGTPLRKQLTDAVVNNIRGLGYSGIGVDTDGKLNINDPNKLSESISNGSFARNFQGIQSFGSKLYDLSLTAQTTVYNSALQESFNNLMNNLINNSGNSAYGDWQTGMAFFPGLIFSIWA